MTRPKNDDTTSLRVIRGGCWIGAVPAWVLATFRVTDAPAYRLNDLGFRCALRGREPLKVTP